MIAPLEEIDVQITVEPDLLAASWPWSYPLDIHNPSSTAAEALLTTATLRAKLLPMPLKEGWRHDGGNICLTVSDSGDTLVAIIIELAATGASLKQAFAGSIALHALAAERLAERTGRLGFGCMISPQKCQC